MSSSMSVCLSICLSTYLSINDRSEWENHHPRNDHLTSDSEPELNARIEVLSQTKGNVGTAPQIRFLIQTRQWIFFFKSQTKQIKQQINTLGIRLTLLQTPTGALALPSKHRLPTLS